MDGWRVAGTTRFVAKAPILRAMGVEPVVVDVFDAAALQEVVAKLRPEVVIHQLTDLPHALAPDKMPEALIRNARVRDEGTRNLVAAAVNAGAKRLIAQSIAFVYADGRRPHREADPLLPITHPTFGGTVRGIISLERQVREAPLEGIVLRYGFFYGPNTGFDAPTYPGSVHIDAAAKAAELALTRGTPGIYNIAEADGAVSSEKATTILGWDPDWRPPVDVFQTRSPGKFR